MLSDADADCMARQVHEQNEYRVLQRAPDPHAAGLSEVPQGGMRLAIVDPSGNVVGHGEPASWLEQPMFDLDPAITRITGITSNY